MSTNEDEYLVSAEQLRDLGELLCSLAKHVESVIPTVKESKNSEVLTTNWKTGFRATLHLLQFTEGLVGKVATIDARKHYNAILIAQESRVKSETLETQADLNPLGAIANADLAAESKPAYVQPKGSRPRKKPAS